MIKILNALCLMIMQISTASCDDFDVTERLLKVESFSKEFESLKKREVESRLNKALVAYLLISNHEYDFLLAREYASINGVILESYPFLMDSGRRYDEKSIVVEDYARRLEEKNPALKKIYKEIKSRYVSVFSRKNPLFGLAPTEVSFLQDFSFIDEAAIPKETLGYWALCKASMSYRYYEDKIFNGLFESVNSFNGEEKDREMWLKEIAKKSVSIELVGLLERYKTSARGQPIGKGKN